MTNAEIDQLAEAARKASELQRNIRECESFINCERIHDAALTRIYDMVKTPWEYTTLVATMKQALNAVVAEMKAMMEAELAALPSPTVCRPSGAVLDPFIHDQPPKPMASQLVGCLMESKPSLPMHETPPGSAGLTGCDSVGELKAKMGQQG